MVFEVDLAFAVLGRCSFSDGVMVIHLVARLALSGVC